MHEMITSIHYKIYTSLRSQFVTSSLEEIFKILDTLVFEAKKTDEKVMGFLKP